MAQWLLMLPPVASLFALVYAAVIAARVMKFDEGTEAMREISAAIKEGASAYLRAQYRAVGLFFLVVFAILLGLHFAGFVVIFVPFAFLSGGLFSGLAGFIGMRIATAAGNRTAQASASGLNQGLRVAFSTGAVMGLVVVGLGLFDLSMWYAIVSWAYRHMPDAERIRQVTSTMLTFGVGASSLALFARVGGGIFTKAADIGADLVGKVEQKIPEDDPRNPAVIADNVGDNVGDVAGMGADLYESFVGSILAAAALAIPAGFGVGGAVLPALVAATGVFASVIGIALVRIDDNADLRSLLGALRRGVNSAGVLTAIAAFFIVRLAFGEANTGLYLSILTGLAAGVAIGFCTEYFTSDQYSPTQDVVSAAESGAATVIIRGLAVGMMSTVAPVLIVCAAILTSFHLSGGSHSFTQGLYGVSIAAVGMLSTLVITLASDAYGPVADNAGGIAKMAGMPDKVRQTTDMLDALGNTTAATGKGFAIGSAALTALAFIAAYKEQVLVIAERAGIVANLDLAVLNPRLLTGLFVGGMLPFLFSALTISSVGRAAMSIVFEVRRQFREIPGILEGNARPDYSRCVSMCASTALREMILPALTAMIVPVVTGLIIGVEGVIGLLAGVTVTGFVMAVFMANAGGTWDNAKKSIEAEVPDRTGTPEHSATVIGDTVGDPLKDTAAPSLNILIKLVSTVSIVFASLILQHSIWK